ncbi:non-canonical purine NTP pyrophosphatase [Candidatus Roizmanbacteria bacterium]|nr:MAG: non-canonical purine NTP pyrophosphatase [Candidatus Roizmanbacteria bacterium]
MNKILIATSNNAKREEITYGLRDLVAQGLQILTLKDVNVTGEPVEDGETFEENAKIKAAFYGKQVNMPVISDDGGLMIDALEGQPGVKSRRWPGYEATDKELIQYALDKMKHIPEENRTAQLVTCICLHFPQSDEYFCEQEGIDGRITKEALTWDTNGYPYRALFVVKEYNKFYDELTEEEHHQINHRLKALRRLKKHIKEKVMV